MTHPQKMMQKNCNAPNGIWNTEARGYQKFSKVVVLCIDIKEILQIVWKLS